MPDQITLSYFIIWRVWKEPAVLCSLYCNNTCAILAMLALPCVHTWDCMCVRACVNECVYTLAWNIQCCSVSCSYCSCHCISLSSYLFVFFFSLPSLFCFSLFFFFFSFSIYCRCCSLLSQMPRPPLWHHGWLCPIRSAAGEGGEWDAGSSESGAGSHHTVFWPWNVSETTTANCAASLSPFSLLPENYHIWTSLYLPGANSAENKTVWTLK